ncbi:MAG: metalloregulator ArsR/SmtB family transcription factor [Nitrososphaerota archaeon]|nr:metalloregulator ArsR/SmtB family transcription factor [Nitrososphaerota archaeon]
MTRPEARRLIPKIGELLLERPECEGIPPAEWIAQLKRTVSKFDNLETLQRAEYFKALSEPTRLKITRLLSYHNELCACEIQMALELTQPLASHHLSILRRSGILSSTKKERWVHYRLSDEARKLLRHKEEPPG